MRIVQMVFSCFGLFFLCGDLILRLDLVFVFGYFFRFFQGRILDGSDSVFGMLLQIPCLRHVGEGFGNVRTKLGFYRVLAFVPFELYR